MSTKLYNNGVILEFDEAKHLYTKDGIKVDGTTGALGVINKPALIPWAVSEAIKFIEANIKAGKSYDEIQLKAILDGAKSAHRKKSETAADMGKIVHDWIKEYIKGNNPSKPVNESCKNAVNKFLEWEKDHNVEFIQSEKQVYSVVYNYAGTLDFIAKVDGKVMIGDFKTSKGIYDEMWLQVAAYQQAYQEEFPSTKFDGALIVRIGKDATLDVKPRAVGAYEKDVIGFNAALVLYRRLQELKEEAYKLKLLN